MTKPTLMIEVKHRFTHQVLFESKSRTLKASVEAAIKVNADLGEADLGEADLRGANLWRADLRGADLGEAELGDAVGIPPRCRRW